MIGRCGYDLTAILGWLDPATCTYEEWVQVGMALKLEGHECGEWDGWSAHDTARFHPGECERKWRSFGNSPASPVTGGTLVEIARVHGWMPSYTEQTFGWDDTLPADCWEPPDGALFDPSWLEDEEIEEPDAWDPVKDTIAYLSALFDSEDYVGYVTESYEKDGRHIPGKGIYTRTAGELVADLGKRGGDLGKALGDYNPDVGAWVRFNPLDGQGVRNANVTEFRYALVESDTLPIERQNALIRSLQLPVACLVHSGGKSLHAIVRIDAKDYDEYRSRVDFLYSECRKNGLDVDTQNKNPSRLSRLPGVLRAGQRQALLATGIGKASWDEWRQWYEAEQDVFPDITPFAQEAGLDLPDPEMVVAGMLAKGDKMMLAGPSKAGKTFALLELAIAVAEGTGWMGRRCTGGDVLYINLEIKRDARIRRMRAIYEALGLTMANAHRLHCLDLRGQAAPIDLLAAKIVRAAAAIGPAAIIIDPIYKVMMGDENSAADVGAFCNALDHICMETGAAVVYCHHHSKGAQGDKSSMDRASGSGVFARDVDALLDFIELHVTDDLRDELGGSENLTAWKVSGTLREFAPPKPVIVTFDFPVHRVDSLGILEDARPKGGFMKKTPEERAEARRAKAEARARGRETSARKFAEQRTGRAELIRQGIKACEEAGELPTVKNVASAITDEDGGAVSGDRLKGWIKSLKENGTTCFETIQNKGWGLEEKPF